MKPMEFAKRAAADKLVDYLLENPEENMGKIMDKLNALLPEALFSSQREAFTHAIEDQSNWYQLLMRVAKLNPRWQVRSSRRFSLSRIFSYGTSRRRCARSTVATSPGPSCSIPPAPATFIAPVAGRRSTGITSICPSTTSIRSSARAKSSAFTSTFTPAGEPLVRKRDLIKLCEKHPDCAFLCFTNATLIDEEFCQDLIRVKNFVPAISAEGDEAATDSRRGQGNVSAHRCGHGSAQVSRSSLRRVMLLHE